MTHQDMDSMSRGTRTITLPCHHRWLHGLVVVHLAVGLAIATVMSVGGRRDHSAIQLPAAFLGIVFGQTSLLGIWASLGTTPWRKRLIGVVVGVSYLVLLHATVFYRFNYRASWVMFGVIAFMLAITLIVWTLRIAVRLDAPPLWAGGDRRLSFSDLLLMAFALIVQGICFRGSGASMIAVLLGATSSVAIAMLILRSFRMVIHPISAPLASADRFQFAIRHLMLLTFVVACLISLGKLLQLNIRYVSGKMVAIWLTCGLVGVLPVWPALAMSRSKSCRVGCLMLAVLVGTAVGYSLGRVFPRRGGPWMTMTTIQAIVVALSLLVVRSAGYRLVRLPSRDGGRLSANRPASDDGANPDEQCTLGHGMN